MSEPVFIDTNLTTIVQELIADYEARTGRTLMPGQVEALILNSWAYRENLLRSQIQNACKQNLVAFSSAPILDYLGQLVGVTRMGAVGATASLRFYLPPLHSSGVIPAGRRVGTTDGTMIFVLSGDLRYSVNDTYVEGSAYCTTPGASANGYPTGTITKLLDPVAGVTSVTNTTTSAGGADQESDDQLRERIRLAPEAFSCAGSRQSYMYWAKTASQSIIDVAVTSPVPGSVKIYPLVAGGVTTSEELLAAVLFACSDEKVRPLCDTVTAESPTAVEWTVTAEISVDPSYVSDEVVAAVEAALWAFHATKVASLGRPVYRNEVIAAIMAVEGVVNVSTLTDPAANVTVAENEFPKLTTVTVTAV